jgi:hypothetical protein
VKELKELAQVYSLIHGALSAGTIVAEIIVAYRAQPANLDPTDRLVNALKAVPWGDHIALYPVLKRLAESGQ